MEDRSLVVRKKSTGSNDSVIVNTSAEVEQVLKLLYAVCLMPMAKDSKGDNIPLFLEKLLNRLVFLLPEFASQIGVFKLRLNKEFSFGFKDSKIIAELRDEIRQTLDLTDEEIEIMLIAVDDVESLKAILEKIKVVENASLNFNAAELSNREDGQQHILNAKLVAMTALAEKIASISLAIKGAGIPEDVREKLNEKLTAITDKVKNFYDDIHSLLGNGTTLAAVFPENVASLVLTPTIVRRFLSNYARNIAAENITGVKQQEQQKAILLAEVKRVYKALDSLFSLKNIFSDENSFDSFDLEQLKTLFSDLLKLSEIARQLKTEHPTDSLDDIKTGKTADLEQVTDIVEQLEAKAAKYQDNKSVFEAFLKDGNSLVYLVEAERSLVQKEIEAFITLPLGQQDNLIAENRKQNELLSVIKKIVKEHNVLKISEDDAERVFQANKNGEFRSRLHKTLSEIVDFIAALKEFHRDEPLINFERNDDNILKNLESYQAALKQRLESYQRIEEKNVEPLFANEKIDTIITKKSVLTFMADDGNSLEKREKVLSALAEVISNHNLLVDFYSEIKVDGFGGEISVDALKRYNATLVKIIKEYEKFENETLAEAMAETANPLNATPHSDRVAAFFTDPHKTLEERQRLFSELYVQINCACQTCASVNRAELASILIPEEISEATLSQYLKNLAEKIAEIRSFDARFEENSLFENAFNPLHSYFDKEPFKNIFHQS